MTATLSDSQQRLRAAPARPGGRPARTRRVRGWHAYTRADGGRAAADRPGARRPELPVHPDGRPARRSCAEVAARLRISPTRVAQLSTNATGKLVAMVRARLAGERLPSPAETDLARFAGLTARWWGEPSRRAAVVA